MFFLLFLILVVIVVGGYGGVLFFFCRPYLCLGTLRDQVLYPHTVTQFKTRGGMDDELDAILQVVCVLMIAV